jgi:hypothetical protein
MINAYLTPHLLGAPHSDIMMKVAVLALLCAICSVTEGGLVHFGKLYASFCLRKL